MQVRHPGIGRLEGKEGVWLHLDGGASYIDKQPLLGVCNEAGHNLPVT